MCELYNSVVETNMKGGCRRDENNYFDQSGLNLV